MRRKISRNALLELIYVLYLFFPIFVDQHRNSFWVNGLVTVADKILSSAPVWIQ